MTTADYIKVGDEVIVAGVLELLAVTLPKLVREAISTVSTVLLRRRALMMVQNPQKALQLRKAM